MRQKTNTLAALGLGALLVAGIGVLGASPAKADSLHIGDYNGHIGFGVTIGNPPYYYGPGYYNPYYDPYYYPPVVGFYDYGGPSYHGDWGHSDWGRRGGSYRAFHRGSGHRR